MLTSPSLFRSRGVTLVEVLVAIVVLSIGLLGIAGLQVATTKYKINTWSRSASASLLSDISERIRFNPVVAGPNFVTKASLSLNYALSENWATQQGKSDASLAVTPNCEAIPSSGTIPTCTAAQRAASDISIWRLAVRKALPQGAALIDGDRSQGFIITLMWFDKENTDSQERLDDGTPPTLVTSTTCSANTAGLAQQTCCPAAAQAPAGVRCARFSFIP